MLSIAESHSSKKNMREVWQEWLLLNPDCMEYNNLLLSRCDFKWRFTCFFQKSKIKLVTQK